jgi:maleamate amidohydrolase
MSVNYGAGARTGAVDFNEEVERIRLARKGVPHLGPGGHAAVIVVDFQVAFLPAADADAQAAVAATARLLQLARAVDVPVYFGAMGADRVEHMDLRWRAHHDLSIFLPGRPGTEIHPNLGLTTGDTLVRKTQASCFFRTGLDNRLRALGVDTVYLCGTSTSGCVRATAVDAASYQYRTLLVEECCYDPRPLSRESALWDLADRYADVISLDTALGELPTRGTATRTRTSVRTTPSTTQPKASEHRDRD